MSENTKKKVSSKKRKSAREKENAIRKGLKHSSGFTFSLFVNIVIVLVIIKLFMYAFNFAYGVFGDVAYHPTATEYVIVDVPADSSILQIGRALEDAEVIEDPFVFYAKVKIKKYGDQIVSGKYHLSASMTTQEILNIICHIETTTEEE